MRTHKSLYEQFCDLSKGMKVFIALWIVFVLAMSIVICIFIRQSEPHSYSASRFQIPAQTPQKPHTPEEQWALDWQETHPEIEAVSFKGDRIVLRLRSLPGLTYMDAARIAEGTYEVVLKAFPHLHPLPFGIPFPVSSPFPEPPRAPQGIPYDPSFEQMEWGERFFAEHKAKKEAENRYSAEMAIWEEALAEVRAKDLAEIRAWQQAYEAHTAAQPHLRVFVRIADLYYPGGIREVGHYDEDGWESEFPKFKTPNH